MATSRLPRHGVSATRVGEEPPPWLDRYLRPGERDVVVTRRHAVSIAEPWLSAFVGLLIVVAVGLRAGGHVGWNAVAPVFVWAWLALIARAMLITYDWRRTWFVATNKRLLLVYGFVIRKVAMMPLGKVTDMTYERSVPGRVLGYGTFEMESAGQDQALRTMSYVPHPDAAYQAIISEIFPDGSEPAARPLRLDDDEEDDDHGRGGKRGRGRSARRRVGERAGRGLASALVRVWRAMIGAPPDPYGPSSRPGGTIGAPRPRAGGADRSAMPRGYASALPGPSRRPGAATDVVRGEVVQGDIVDGESLYKSWPDTGGRPSDGYGPEGPPTDPLGPRV